MKISSYEVTNLRNDVGDHAGPSPKSHEPTRCSTLVSLFSLDDRGFHRALFGLLNNLAIDFAPFSHFITKKVILDIINSLVDNQFRHNAAQLLLSCVAARDLEGGSAAEKKQRQIKQWLISSPMMFRRIWFIIIQSNDDRLQRKGLNILLQTVDTTKGVKALLECKAFDIDIIVEIDTEESRELLSKMYHKRPKLGKFEHNPDLVESLQILQAAISRLSIESISESKTEPNSGFTKVQKLKRLLGKWSNYVAVSTEMDERASKAVVVDAKNVVTELNTR